MKILAFFLTTFIVVFAHQNADSSQPSFTAFRSKGFRVCIADAEDLRLFGIKGNVDGPPLTRATTHYDFSGDTTVKTGSEWCVVNMDVFLKKGSHVRYISHTQVGTERLQQRGGVRIKDINIINHSLEEDSPTVEQAVHNQGSLNYPTQNFTSVFSDTKLSCEVLLNAAKYELFTRLGVSFVTPAFNQHQTTPAPFEYITRGGQNTAEQCPRRLGYAEESIENLRRVLDENQQLIETLNDSAKLAGRLNYYYKSIIDEAFKATKKLFPAATNKLFITKPLITQEPPTSYLNEIINVRLRIEIKDYKIVDSKRQWNGVLFEVESYEQKLIILFASRTMPERYEINDFDEFI